MSSVRNCTHQVWDRLTPKEFCDNLEKMPYRFVPFASGEIYHVFNRSVARQPIFITNRHYQRALDTINYYRFVKPKLRFSHYYRLPLKLKEEFMQKLETTQKTLVDILAFCVMPNHFHFLLRQSAKNGIPIFMRNVQNSYAKYFNTKSKRTGALFQAMFKGIRIETDEQLFHVSRYVHLNPLTSYIVSDLTQLDDYPWSSYGTYIGKRQHPFVDTREIISYFGTVEKIKTFTSDQAAYQQALEEIRHLLLENP